MRPRNALGVLVAFGSWPEPLRIQAVERGALAASLQPFAERGPGARVEDAVRLGPGAAGLADAVGHVLELADRVRIRVDDDRAPELQGAHHVLGAEVAAVGGAVELDGDV